MKKSITFVLLFVSTLFYAQGQGVVGKWKTIDDQSGEEKSVVEIYEKSGKIYGKVLEIFDASHRKDRCIDCEGEDTNKPVIGLTVIKGLKKDGNEYNSGKILDPKNGKVYKCFITLESKDKLKVRGYIGFALLGRTQYWYRVK
ncbi:DUF2147 domain-containing protein [Flavobacterium sp. ALD4]|jgi:uncharacterized protein (DUF2147 family)|uniref:DUF2147 domain-containing protein n=1 Tax=Flavobacterium sp. ALD4 TaxID=2058314 RepID=UPI000C3308C8|nr:DUF2147 domain-containing protein [Flavobacterium sp. ALD4]PKH68457.1 DUF2147 domain-containing protein [Flavobacterium sp. ALD4]